MGREPGSPAGGDVDAKVCPTCQQALHSWQEDCPACRDPAALRFGLAMGTLPVPAHLRDAIDDDLDDDAASGSEAEALGPSDVAQDPNAEVTAHKPEIAPFEEELPVPFPIVGHFLPGGLAGGDGAGGAGCGDGGC